MSTTISITPGRTWVTGETVTAAKMNAFLTAATIDSDDIVPVGTMSASFALTAPTGYVFLAGKTMGNAASGGTERANADTEELFELLWDNLTDTEAPVSSGRGGSAQADFDANKTITIPDGRGRLFAGLDTMSSTSSANRLTNASGGVDGDVLGDTGGDERHTLGTGEMPAHTHDTTAVPSSTANAAANGTDDREAAAQTAITSTSAGGGSSHNNVQPTLITTFIIKL